MKKNYSKPTITFESFKLSTSIAGDCVHQATALDPNSCEFQTSMGFNIFVEKCEFPSSDGENGVCYHNPTADLKVFAS